MDAVLSHQWSHTIGAENHNTVDGDLEHEIKSLN